MQISHVKGKQTGIYYWIENGKRKPVADPGLPRGGGANSPGGGGCLHTILPYFQKNYMKLKEFGRPGGDVPAPP